MKTLKELRESFMSLRDDTTTANVAGFAEPFKHEKKKKKQYDGRTKEGKKFVERMLRRRDKKLEEKDKK
jgi:hypothetical protein|tara:strand:+ start:223 stop:429 length:207 start_codon:yes stop_codon:yes gene_type:complete